MAARQPLGTRHKHLASCILKSPWCTSISQGMRGAVGRQASAYLDGFRAGFQLSQVLLPPAQPSVGGALPFLCSPGWAEHGKVQTRMQQHTHGALSRPLASSAAGSATGSARSSACCLVQPVPCRTPALARTSPVRVVQAVHQRQEWCHISPEQPQLCPSTQPGALGTQQQAGQTAGPTYAVQLRGELQGPATKQAGMGKPVMQGCRSGTMREWSVSTVQW